MHALKALWPGSTIKRWLGSNSSEAKPAAAPAPAPAPAAPQPPQPVAARVQPPITKAPVASKPAVAPTVIHENNLLRLPLKPIFDRLSPTLAALANAEQISDTDEIALQIDNILTQLPGGVVRISFGELRNSTSPGIFGAQSSHDYTLIDVPLPEILARINPSLLQLPANRKRIDVPQDVIGVFGKNGAGTAIITEPDAFQQGPRERKPAHAMPTPPPTRVAAQTPAAALEAPAALRLNPQIAPVQQPSAIAMPPRVHPKPAAPFEQPVQRNAPIAMPGQPSAPIAMPTQAPAVAKQAAAPVAPMRAEPPSEPLIIPLATLTENWPAAIKAEVEQARPAVASIAIPLSRLEAPMKTGRLNFTWGQLRQWLKPTPLLGTTAHGDTEIQLALNVIAPLFFAHPARNAAAKKKAEIAQDIPDVFGSNSAANAIRELASVPVAKITPPTAPALPMPNMPVAPAVAAQGGSATNLQLRMAQSAANGNGHAPAAPARMPETADNTVLFGKKPAAAPAAQVNGGSNGIHAEAAAPAFPKLDWTPETAVKVSCCTPGVAGAMIAAEDGLMVATQLPPLFKSETLSAFVPQIFQRAAQSAAELALPALNSVRLSFGEQHCEIFKTGKLYYVIIGKAGEELPIPFLRKVAAELTKRN